MADLLKVGQDAAGSYALSDSKNNILALTLESYLNTIADVINRDLVPQTLAVNGWKFSDKEMPRLTFGKIEDRDLDDLGKFVQRVMAVGAMSADKNLDKALRDISNLPCPNYDEPMPDNEGNTSRSGDGMSEGLPNGTGDASEGGDDSVGNTENA